MKIKIKNQMKLKIKNQMKMKIKTQNWELNPIIHIRPRY